MNKMVICLGEVIQAEQVEAVKNNPALLDTQKKQNCCALLLQKLILM